MSHCRRTPAKSACHAPIDRTDAAVRRGNDIRVDVVVRTRKVGHFFPAGRGRVRRWLELQATDEKGRRFLEWQGCGQWQRPVEAGAHFYRSLQIDGHGNPSINETLGRRGPCLRPPRSSGRGGYGALSPAHSGNAGDKITLHAKLTIEVQLVQYAFSFAGVEEDVTE